MTADASLDLGSAQHTLGEIASLLEPQAYREWRGEVEARQRAALNSSFPSWERSEFAVHLADLRYGTSYSRFTKEQQRFNSLLTRLHDAVRRVIASNDYVTKAILADGTDVEVPRNRAGQLKIDLGNNTLSTPDGGVTWRAIVIKAIAAGQPDDDKLTRQVGIKAEPHPEPPLRKVKRQETLVEQARAAIRRLYAGGLVTDSYNTIITRIEAVEKKRFSMDVIRRALDKKS